MSRHIVVVGDALLDRDINGAAERLCPDAPAPVIDVDRDVHRPGGAALAAALLAADGYQVTLVAAVGEDPAGDRLADLVATHGIHLLALRTEGTTREKMRVRAASRTLLRLDLGTPCPPTGPLPTGVEAALAAADAVLVSDYAGGVTSCEPLRDLVARRASEVPVVWDPHPRGAAPVPGAVATPNGAEAAALSGIVSGGSAALALAHRQADALVSRWDVQAVCVTLGPRGALLSYGSGAPLVVPAPVVPDADTCGAGDRFASAMIAALSDRLVVSDAVQAAVRAASAFVAAGGAAGLPGGWSAPSQPGSGAAVGMERIQAVRAVGGIVVATGGCFDLLHAGHVALLEAARALGDCLVVCLNSDASVARLKGAERPLVPQVDRVRVLEALEHVDAVLVFDEDTPDQVLRRLRPQIWVKGGDYAMTDLPEGRVLTDWGGESVVLPYLDGRSTTGLIGSARAGTGSSTRSRTGSMEES